ITKTCLIFASGGFGVLGAGLGVAGAGAPAAGSGAWASAGALAAGVACAGAGAASPPTGEASASLEESPLDGVSAGFGSGCPAAPAAALARAPPRPATEP